MKSLFELVNSFIAILFALFALMLGICAVAAIIGIMAAHE